MKVFITRKEAQERFGSKYSEDLIHQPALVPLGIKIAVRVKADGSIEEGKSFEQYHATIADRLNMKWPDEIEDGFVYEPKGEPK